MSIVFVYTIMCMDTLHKMTAAEKKIAHEIFGYRVLWMEGMGWVMTACYGGMKRNIAMAYLKRLNAAAKPVAK